MTREEFISKLNILYQAFVNAIANGQYYPELFNAQEAIKFKNQGFTNILAYADSNYIPGSDTNSYVEAYKNTIRRIKLLNVTIPYEQLGIDSEKSFEVSEVSKKR